MLDLIISIINTNNGPYLKKCIESIVDQTKDITYEIWVIDNASIDNSVTMVRENFPKVKLISNNEREGFSQNHNKVLKNTEARYKLILNEDTLILNHAFEKLVKFLDDNKEISAVGPKLLFGNGRIQCSKFSFPSIASEVQSAIRGHAIIEKRPTATYAECDWLNGSCILFRSEALTEVGFMDEGFFIFYEDTDICKRLHQAGHSVYYYPPAEVIHYYGKSQRGEIAKTLLGVYYKSRARYFLKHKGVVSFLIIKCIFLITDLLKLLKGLLLYLKKDSNAKDKISRALIGIRSFF